MTTVPGTYFTQEQLETELSVDNVSGGYRAGSSRMYYIGYKYHYEKQQYDKALAWYILAAKENHSIAQNNIGVLYSFGYGVPKNYLCALKWYLKSNEGNDRSNNPSTIGGLFEKGCGVPLDKHKALEWYLHGYGSTNTARLEIQGYRLSPADKKKTIEQLKKETKDIIDAEKKKLEEKQDKTQEEMETLEQLKITYQLVDGGADSWKDVPILLTDDQQCDIKLVISSDTNKDNEILELKKQIQQLKQDRDTFESQAKQLQSLKQEKADLELQIKENKLKLKFNSLKNQLSLQKENQLLKRRIDALEQENRALKQGRTQQQATIQNTGPSNNSVSPTNIDPSHHDQHDDSYNDINYESENSDFDEGGANDINYDTPSEDESSNNDLNYDDAN